MERVGGLSPATMATHLPNTKRYTTSRQISDVASFNYPVAPGSVPLIDLDL